MKMKRTVNIFASLHCHYLFLPLLFLLIVLVPWQLHHNGFIAVMQINRGAEIGSSVALGAEQHNRQLHQKEIAWIKSHSLEFAKELYGNNPTPEQIADANGYRIRIKGSGDNDNLMEPTLYFF